MDSANKGLIARGLRILKTQGIASLTRETLRRVRLRTSGMMFHGSAAREFKCLAVKADSVDKAIELAYSFGRLGINIWPIQNREEVTEFSHVAESVGPGVVLEIGPAQGGTLFVLSRAAKPDATLISLDLPAKLFGMGHPRWMDGIFELFPMGFQRLHILRGNSHDASTAEMLEHVLAGLEIDLLFIDGDHSYEGVKSDFEMYSKYVRKGGIVAFHDIVPHTRNPDIRVCDFWTEVKGRFKNLEIVKHEGLATQVLEGGGIGILYI